MFARATLPERCASRGEILIAGLAAIACLLLTLRIWTVVASGQNTWPVPAVYFLELAGLSLACAIGYWLCRAWRHTLTWIAVGVLAAFCILGAWSIGLYYVPIAGLFLTLAVGDDPRNGGSLGTHAAVGSIAMLVQAAVMLLLVRMM